MNYSELLKLVIDLSNGNDTFDIKSQKIIKHTNILSLEDLINIIENIHVIPEALPHDSTAEKLYAKLSDAIVSKAFTELGLTSRVVTERADVADVIANSPLHNYSLVADSKVFRLSRTAKNQKDFKVESLSRWRYDNDFAVLIAPLYQYPSNKSQIYNQSLEHGVALITFEHLSFLLKNNIVESGDICLKNLFSFPSIVSENIKHSERKMAAPLFKELDSVVRNISASQQIDIDNHINDFLTSLSKRAKLEIKYWKSELVRINNLSREEAIEELIKATKINNKIQVINKYVLKKDALSDELKKLGR